MVVGITGAVLLRPRLAQERAAFAPDSGHVPGQEFEDAGVAVSGVLTPATGFFRPLILNVLWLRVDALQKEKRFFEAASLATAISELQPRIPEVWTFQAWNLGYNVTFHSPPRERYQWIEEAIRLLRDRGLDKNPGAARIYRNLSGFFFFKIDGVADSANLLYKHSFARDLDDARVGSGGAPPPSREDLLREWRLDALFLDDLARRHLGPDKSGDDLDLRIASVHGLYWAAAGLAQPERPVDRWERYLLRRFLIASLDQMLDHGRVVRSAVRDTYAFAPDLRLEGAVERVLEESARLDADDEVIVSEIAESLVQLRQRVVLYTVLENRYDEARELWREAGFADSGVSLERFLALQVIREDDRESATRELALERLAYLVRGVLGLALAGEQSLAAGVHRIAVVFRDDWNSSSDGESLPEVDDVIGAIARAWSLRFAAEASTRDLAARLRQLAPAAFRESEALTPSDLGLPAPRSEEDARGTTFIPGLASLGPASEEIPGGAPR